jgi:alanyl-tRNA synthetase
VDQKGSIVLPDKLRFDFSNNGVVEAAKLAEVEAICQQFLAQPQQGEAAARHPRPRPAPPL